jgi:pSer/pThr/pTyr-binding forkhead associated (FHA) protein
MLSDRIKKQNELQVHKDNKVVQELSVPALKRISIGRREDADWIIEHPSGSRQHACIELDTSGLYVTDLGSAHGTTKNGERLPAQKKVLLKSGDALMFGGRQGSMKAL